ncbi:MAG: trans-sulfuration enzyme family protein, partial [Alphaproteobacteria bacterium]
MDIRTKLCNLGRNPSKHFRTVNTPIYKTSTYVYETMDEFIRDSQPFHTDATYGRSGTPTSHALQDAIKAIEGSQFCTLTASGLSSIVIAVLGLVKAGEHILVPDTAYKCSHRFFDEELTRLDISFDYYDATITDEIIPMIRSNTKLLFLESPGSGTFEVQDFRALCKIAKDHNLLTIADNSWATPLFLNPFDLGVDVCVMSLTKYFSGHSDLLMGSISCNDLQIHNNIHRAFLNYASAPSPDDAFLVLRGLRTLKTRLDYHEKSALEVAQFLEAHPKVERVMHPALESNKGYEIWKRDFTGSTGLFSFKPYNNNEKELHKFIESLNFFSIALSWGCFESLIMPYKLSQLPTIM